MSITSCSEVIASCTWILKQTGLYPRKTLTFLDRLKHIFHLILHIITYTVIASNIVIAIFTRNKSLFSWQLPLFLPVSHYYLKMKVLIMPKRRFFSILKDLKSNEFNSHNQNLNKHIKNLHNITKFLVKYFSSLAVIALTIFCLFPIIYDSLMLVPPPIHMGDFDIFYKILHSLFMGCITWNYIGVETLYMTLLGLSAAQLRILRTKIANVLDGTQESLNEENIQNKDLLVQTLLKDCIILHCKINKFVKELSIMLSLPLFAQYLSCCLVFCYITLQLSILVNENSTTLIGIYIYAGIVFAQMAVYHWLGNEIIIESEQIIRTCSLLNWYKMGISSQKMLSLIMERAKKPLAIKVYGLFFISLDSLVAVIKSSYSLLAVLKSSE